ncbi:MAG: long-chain fatty acid--CoA ligase [Deltaproteobacteria bacterium]|nr:long-chain fatty acid--CoA ligase [Deltaproteobacteria bacterium]
MGGILALRTVSEIPFHHAAARGGKAALIADRGEPISYAELDARVRRFAAFLGARGRGAGERVGILLPNLPEFVVAYFGAIAAGAVAVPVNYRLAASEVGYILSDCSAGAVVTTTEKYGKLSGESQCGGVSDWLLVDGDAPGALSFDRAISGEPLAAPTPCSPDDVASLLYTSGTTGFPKGAMITHANILFNVASCRATLGYREDDVGLITLPLFHVTGLHSQLVALLACGGTVVLQREYETRRMLELIARHRATALFLVPAIYKLLTIRPDLHEFDLSAVRIAAYGGAPMDPETIRALNRVLPAELHNCYGLTECSSLGTVLPSALALSRAGSVGFPVPGMEAQVRSPGGEVLPADRAGELFLRGPNIVKGYFGDPAKTQAALGDGWLRTGDIARIDAEGLGYILDRAKDMINRGGEKVYGLEVENVLYAFPGMAEAAVFGIPHPIFGEVPAAAVVPMPGAALDPEKIREHCRSRLADYKVPVEVRIVGQLPRNPGGKVLKQELKGIWAKGLREERS